VDAPIAGAAEYDGYGGAREIRLEGVFIQYLMQTSKTVDSILVACTWEQAHWQNSLHILELLEYLEALKGQKGSSQESYHWVVFGAMECSLPPWIPGEEMDRIIKYTNSADILQNYYEYLKYALSPAIDDMNTRISKYGATKSADFQCKADTN
jgi:hypothetical protein